MPNDVGLQQYSQALKAFRRASYQNPDNWTCVVLCCTFPQLQLAYYEACRVLEGGSLPFTANQTQRRIDTERNTSIRFLLAENAEERVKGMEIEQVITLYDITPRLRDVLRTQQRSPDSIWNECTL